MDSDRSISAANDLTLLAASVEAVTSEVWTSRAPAIIDAAGAEAAAESACSTAAANVLTSLAASGEGVTSGDGTSRAPPRVDAAAAVPAAGGGPSAASDRHVAWVA